MLLGLLFNLGWIGYAAVPVAVAALIVLAFKADAKIEQRRRLAIDIQDELGKQGFTMFAELLKSYAVGDKSGMLKTLIELTKMVKDPEMLEAQLSRVFRIQLGQRVQEPSTRLEIAQALKDVEVLEKADLETKLVEQGITKP